MSVTEDDGDPRGTAYEESRTQQPFDRAVERRGGITSKPRMSSILTIGMLVLAGGVALAWKARAPDANAGDSAQSKKGSPSARGMPPALRESIDKDVSEIRTVQGLERFLSTLESRARANRKVTAFEVEPGLQAIRRQAPVLGNSEVLKRATEFSKRMASLSRQLELQSHSAETKP